MGINGLTMSDYKQFSVKIDFDCLIFWLVSFAFFFYCNRIEKKKQKKILN